MNSSQLLEAIDKISNELLAIKMAVIEQAEFVNKFKNKDREITVYFSLIERICHELDVTWIEIQGHSRSAPLPDYRSIFAFQLRRLGFTYESIARMMNRDHSSIKAAHDRYIHHYEFEPQFKNRASMVDKLVKQYETAHTY